MVHWLDPDKNNPDLTPNNTNAAFKKNTEKDEPSGLLLHYTYGAKAVSKWGCGKEVLTKLAKPPRPSPSAAVTAMGPHRTVNNRQVAIDKRDRAQNPDGAGGGNFTARTETGEFETSEGETLDGDEVMLFFWGNSKAARERHHQKAEEDARRMESWRNSVVQGVVTSF